MRVLQIICSLSPLNGGPTRSTVGLAQALAHGGDDVVVLVCDARCEAKDERRLQYVMGRGDVYRTALEEVDQLIVQFKPDVIHIQGLWRPSHHAAAVAARKRGIPYVVSPRGMLAPWALGVKRWKKRLGMLLFQRDDLRRAAAIPCTSVEEAQHTRMAGFANPTPVVPNGVDVPDFSNVIPVDVAKGKKIALFMSRLTPGKGLMLLAEAWAKTRPSGWMMIVAGPDEHGHRYEVEAKIRDLGIEGDWRFVGEVSDVEKWRYYAASDLFIHPSASENFGMSIAEALASGVPVITTKGTPWKDLEHCPVGLGDQRIDSCRCGWWIDRTPECLSQTMKVAMNLSEDEREGMGRVGREWITEEFSWARIGRNMHVVYANILLQSKYR